MAPNLKKIALLSSEPLATDLAFLAVASPAKNQQPAEAQRQSAECASPSYWDWHAEEVDADDGATIVVADLFSAEHLQSNLIQVAAELNRVREGDGGSKFAASSSSDEYWAERVLPSSGVESSASAAAASSVPQNHPLNLSLEEEDSYWTDVRDGKLESDAYWAQPSQGDGDGSRSDRSKSPSKNELEASDSYWDESSRGRPTDSDAYWSTGGGSTSRAAIASPSAAERSAAAWDWSHRRSESDRYWRWETPAPAALLGC
jgi:hypothetical protein